MIAASPAKGCGSSCLRSCAGEEGSSWPSGPPVMRAGGCDDHILSDGRLHLSPFPPAPKEQVRSMLPSFGDSPRNRFFYSLRLFGADEIRRSISPGCRSFSAFSSHHSADTVLPTVLYDHFFNVGRNKRVTRVI